MLQRTYGVRKKYAWNYCVFSWVSEVLTLVLQQESFADNSSLKSRKQSIQFSMFYNFFSP